MNISRYFILLLLFSSISSCKKDEELLCPTKIDIGSLHLLQETKDLYPYSLDTIDVIFSDSLGNEIKAMNIVTTASYGRLFSKDVVCLNDTLINIEVCAQSESISSLLSISEVDLQFRIQFSVSPDIRNYDESLVSDIANITTSRISFNDPNFINPIPQIAIELDQRTKPQALYNPSVPDPQILIHGKEFKNVYTNDLGEDVIKLFYNHSQGIVAFQEIATNTIYKFERFE